MVSRNRKIARRIGQAVANDVLDISGAISAGAGVTVYATADDLPTTGLTAGDEAFVSGSNRLYISNGTGWYSIGLVNTNPAITSVEDPSTNTTPFTLATDGSALVLTITAADPEDIPLTYSYAVTTGSLTNGGGTTATVVQGTGANTNQFTITPTTTEAYAGTFDLTFTTSDGINQASSVNSFTLSFITTITNSNYTTLLATATGTSDNNNITDTSTNNHTITVNGDAYAGTFSPYRSGGYSTYFDGNDYLTTTQTTPLGTTDFTIEGWVNFDNVGGNRTFMTLDSTTQLYFRNNGSSIAIYKGGSAYNFSTGTPEVNTWYHFAFVRQSGSVTLYWNGQSKGSTSHAHDYTSGYLHIGCWSAISEFFQGHLTDIKISNTAVYTSNFSVPTERLSSDSSTKLLICHLPYIADGSNLNETIAVNGDPSTKPFSPYDYTEYSATDHGGSVYFDGTTDYLLINSPPTLGANDWTFETWYYASNPLTYNILLSQGPGNNTVVSNFSVSSSGEIAIQTYTTTNVVLYATAAGIIKGDTWNHIALTHDYDGSNGGTYKIYVNGNQVGSNVSYTSGYYWNSGGIAGTALAMAQYRYNTQANGECYFSDWKISNSVTYSSNFTPPTAPLSSSGSVLHIKGTDASIIDKSQVNNLKLIGGPTGSTTQAKFSNTKSIDFGDGSLSYVMEVPSGAGYTGLFTIEFWMYNTYATSPWQSLISNSYVNGSEYFRFYKNNGSGAFALYHNSTSAKLTGIGNITNNTWTHVAIVRDSSNDITVYQDGTSIGSYNNSQIFGTASNPINVGKGGVGDTTNYPMSGYIQDLRITNGLARYTANFTPPTAPLEG